MIRQWHKLKLKLTWYSFS